MSFREEQCNKVCRILDDVLANRPTERDSLITAVRIAFSALNCSEIPNSSDSISRQKAIDALDKRFDSVPMEQTTEILMLRKDLRALPSSQPRNKGEWIDYSDEGYVECPFCHSATNCDGNKDELHYCFSCGAELRPQYEEPEINPCRGCEDYDGKGGCKTKGGCAESRCDSDD